MRKALVQGERIAQIVPADADFPVAPPLSWIDVADDSVTTDHGYQDGGFVPPQTAPGTPRTIDLNAFLDRLDETAQLALFEARRQDARIDHWLTRAAVEPFDLDSPDLFALLDHLITAGLITTDDKDVLLEG